MDGLNPDCWICSTEPPSCLLPQHSGSPASGSLDQREQKEEEAGANPAACCYTTGCNDIMIRAGNAQRPTFGPPAPSEIPSSSGLAGRSPIVVEADRGIVPQHFTGGCCWDCPDMKPQSCVCVFGQREPECVGPCWPGSPYICYGVRRNLLVGLEVVEEVAVEDTVELVTEDIYADDLLQENQLYPT